MRRLSRPIFLALALGLLAACWARGPKAPPASMDRAIGLDGWLLVTSPGIEIASAAGERRTLELARELQIFRALARALSQAPVEPRLPTRVVVFRDRQAYEHFGSRHTAGEFHWGLRGFVLVMSADDTSARHTLFHEYVHFLLHNQSLSYPTWYDEGFAELLGSASIREHIVTVGALVGREATLADPERLLPLETLLGARSYADADTRVDGFYAQSWLLAHLLILGHHAGHPRRVDALRSYLAALQTAPDWRRAFDAAFPEGLDALARDLEAYRQRVTGDAYLPRIRLDARKLDGAQAEIDRNALAPADVAAELGAAYLDRGPDSARYAERLFERALERDPAHARARAGLARAQALQGSFDAAFAELARAEASAPDDAFVLRARGAVLLLQADSLSEADAAGAEAARSAARGALRRAVALEPGVPEGRVLLGRSYIGAEGDPAEGLAALAEAHALLPWNEEINLDLARLYAQAGRTEPALEHVDRVLRWSHGDQLEQARALRAEIERGAAGSAARPAERSEAGGS